MDWPFQPLLPGGAQLLSGGGTVNASFTLDAVLLRTQSGSFTLDAVVKREQTASFTLDACLVRTQAATLTLDAVVMPVFTLDAVLLRTQSASFTLDAVLDVGGGEVEASFLLDVVLFKAISASFTLDAVITEPAVRFSLDATIRRIQTASYTLDAFISTAILGSFTLRALTKDTLPGSFDLNAVIAARAFRLDAVIKRLNQTASFTLDAVLEAPSFTLDATITLVDVPGTPPGESPVPPAGSVEPGQSSINVFVGNSLGGGFTDFAGHMVYSKSRFESQVNGSPGTATFFLKDLAGTMSILPGQDVLLMIDGLPIWRGFISSIKRVYMFPAINVDMWGSKRIYQIDAVDQNILFRRRYVFNQADPANVYGTEFPAGTPDTVALTDLFANFIDLDGDDIDVTTFVENVADINLDQKARVLSGSMSWGDTMRAVAALPGAVFYLLPTIGSNPRSYLVYTDVDTPNAPFALSDTPLTTSFAIIWTDAGTGSAWQANHDYGIEIAPLVLGSGSEVWYLSGSVSPDLSGSTEPDWSSPDEPSGPGTISDGNLVWTRATTWTPSTSLLNFASYAQPSTPNSHAYSTSAPVNRVTGTEEPDWSTTGGDAGDGTPVPVLSYRDMEILADGTNLANDVLAWGAGYGSASPVFVRDQDGSSIDDHGRWQRGELKYGIWRQASIDRVADSILNGSPSNKRGHKDDRMAVELTVFKAGLMPSQKVDFTSSVFSFNDVIPIRRMVVTFEAPAVPKFQLTLSHEIDVPSAIIDTLPFLFPEIVIPPPPPPPLPECIDDFIDTFNNRNATGDIWGQASSGPTWFVPEDSEGSESFVASGVGVLLTVPHPPASEIGGDSFLGNSSPVQELIIALGEESTVTFRFSPTDVVNGEVRWRVRYGGTQMRVQVSMRSPRLEGHSDLHVFDDDNEELAELALVPGISEWQAGQYYFLRIHRGTAVTEVKLWPDGGTEPAEYQLSIPVEVGAGPPTSIRLEVARQLQRIITGRTWLIQHLEGAPFSSGDGGADGTISIWVNDSDEGWYEARGYALFDIPDIGVTAIRLRLGFFSTYPALNGVLATWIVARIEPPEDGLAENFLWDPSIIETITTRSIEEFELAGGSPSSVGLIDEIVDFSGPGQFAMFTRNLSTEAFGYHDPPNGNVDDVFAVFDPNPDIYYAYNFLDFGFNTALFASQDALLEIISVPDPDAQQGIAIDWIAGCIPVVQGFTTPGWIREVFAPTGTTYTLAHTPIPFTERVFVDGVLLGSTAYTIDPDTKILELDVAPTKGVDISYHSLGGGP